MRRAVLTSDAAVSVRRSREGRSSPSSFQHEVTVDIQRGDVAAAVTLTPEEARNLADWLLEAGGFGRALTNGIVHHAVQWGGEPGASDH